MSKFDELKAKADELAKKAKPKAEELREKSAPALHRFKERAEEAGKVLKTKAEDVRDNFREGSGEKPEAAPPSTPSEGE